MNHLDFLLGGCACDLLFCRSFPDEYSN